MTDIQREHYGNAEQISSDAVGILPRDNRNHRKKQQLILEHVAADPGDRVLEVGCGDGLHAQAYAQRFEYAGVDISPSLVEQTRRRVDAVADSWTVRQDDALDLDWEDDTFAAVVGTAILHHLPEPRKALEEWIRVVNPGGSVTLVEPNYLFPKAFVSTQLAEEERHKRHMAPWRLRRTLAAIEDATGAEAMLQPRIYTPPWPAAAAPFFDSIDRALRRAPGIRWLSQMQLIHLTVPTSGDSRRS